MDYLNIFGLVIMIIIMIPNVIFAIKVKNFESKYSNKCVEIIEQIGRFGSMFLMVFNVPFWQYGFWFDNAKNTYMILISILALLYCFTWTLYFRKETLMKAMLLAIIPTIIFLASGIVQLQMLLIITSILFGIGHIMISYKNNQ